MESKAVREIMDIEYKKHQEWLHKELLPLKNILFGLTDKDIEKLSNKHKDKDNG